MQAVIKERPWKHRVAAWLLRTAAVSVFAAAMLAAGFLLTQNWIQDRIGTGRADEGDMPVKTIEQRIAEPQRGPIR
jgi:hypothetical protein